MNRYRSIAIAALLLSLPASAQELLRTFSPDPAGATSVTSEIVVKPDAQHEFVYTPLAPQASGTLSAWDVSRGTALTVRQTKAQAKIALPAVASEKAEIRIRIEETIPGTGLTMNRVFPKGRYVFRLPAGYVLESCSLPAQIEEADGRITVGVVQGSDLPASLSLNMRKGVGASPPAAFTGNFTAQDNRVISYQLLDPANHQIRLWLEMYVDKPGQSHFYSQLRLQDHTSDPVTLDVDRGIELPTRIVSGKEANDIGDSPSHFPDDALVLVADLGYSVPANGSARLRSFQTATDPEGYRLVDPDDLRLDRFISRTRTQFILPAGWSLLSMDQPGVISRTPDGRAVIDFVATSAQGSRLTILAHRNAATTPPQ